MKVYIFSIELHYEGRIEDYFVCGADDRTLEDAINLFAKDKVGYSVYTKNLKQLSNTQWTIENIQNSVDLVIELEEVH